MKNLRYIYTLLIALLFGLAISSCDEDEASSEEREMCQGTVKTTFTIGISAPDVSGDIDVETRATNSDNANIDFAKPENGGRFKNLIVVLVDNDQEELIYGIRCREYMNSLGVTQDTVIFPNVDVPASDVNNDLRKYKVYAFGNVCQEHFDAIKAKVADINKNIEENTYSNGKIGNRWKLKSYSNNPNLLVKQYCIESNISVNQNADINKMNKDKLQYIPIRNLPIYNINFKPSTTYQVEYQENGTNKVANVTSVGMPENNCAKATVIKGTTRFNVQMKRVCARLQITFRNLTGQYYDKVKGEVDNNIYVDEFKIDGIFKTSTKYFYDGSDPGSYQYGQNIEGNSGHGFDILRVLECKNDSNQVESDHINNKIENGESVTISMYIFESQISGNYKLKIDRGKSLGNRADNLQDGNLYVLWSDNLDPYYPGFLVQDKHNTFNRCLGAEASNDQANNHHFVYGEDLKYGEDMYGNVTNELPFGSYSDDSKFGNRIFWKFHKSGDNQGKFENYKVNMLNDFPEATGYYLPTKINNSEHLANNINNAGVFTISTRTFENMSRSYLKYGSNCLMISNDKLQFRNIGVGNFTQTKPYYPWVFFAKYIMKDGNVKDMFGKGYTQRNNSYEIVYNVMPNYDEEVKMYVRSVRPQSSIEWDEVQK